MAAEEAGPPPAADLEDRSEEHSSSGPKEAVVLAAVVLAGMIILIVYGYLDMPGSGLIGVANKRLWDYLELLIVPAALALGVYWLNRRQDERDQQAEEERSKRECAAQAEQVERALRGCRVNAHMSRGVYSEVSGLGGRSGEDDGEQCGHEGTEYVRELITGAG